MNNQNSTMTVGLKAKVLEALLLSEYEELIQIDIATGMSVCLYAADEHWKKTMGTLFNYEEVLKNYMMDFIGDTEPDKVLELLSLSSAVHSLEKQLSHVATFVVTGSGKSFRVKRAVFFPGGDGEVYLLIKDITEGMRQAEQKIKSLQQALDEAEEKITERDTFLSLMDHNLRTPLYSIMGLTHIAGENSAQHSFDDYLHKISMSGSYMQETIDDMLMLRQIAQNNIVPNPVPMELGEFFSEMRRMIRPTINENGLLFQMDTQGVASVSVLADKKCMEQIVLKMLKSMIEYAVRGSRICLGSRVVYQVDRKISLEISFESRGIVMDQERLSMLFKPYDYLDEHLQGDARGVDIALMILRSNLLAMGADSIIAETDEQKGTRISVALPLPLADAPVRSVTSVEVPDFAGKHILLVDDNEISMDVSEKLLVSTGMQVTRARDGKEAAEIFEKAEGRFDLILMDVLMPVMDGLASTRKIRSMKEIANAETVPIIALTVNAFRENFEESLQAGMNAHLVKPVRPENLYRVLREFLEEH